MTLSEAAAKSGIPVRTLRHASKTGALEVNWIGPILVTTADALAKYKAQWRPRKVPPRGRKAP